MENGDLAVSVRPRIVVVLEGVLATVTQLTEHRRLRGDKVTGYNVEWYDTPLKRIAYLRRNWPQTGIDVVTFVADDVCDLAAEFFDRAMIPIDTTEYWRLDEFTSILPFQDDIAQILDSNEDRLDRYGQLGRAVLLGQDF